MARRRMFSVEVVDTDRFLDMTHGARCLYFHLGMHADDDGFVASPKKVLRIAGCADADLDELIRCGFVIEMESGLIVITHWKLQNLIKKDRYVPTVHTKHLKKLRCEGGVYSMKSEESQLGNSADTNWNQTGTKMEIKGFQDGTQLEHNWSTTVDIVGPQYSIVKNSINNIVEQSSTEGVFSEVITYLNQKTGKNFRANCKATQRLISARVSEGFTVSDLKRVIDTKCEQWLNDTERKKYLRPETLFSATHFESYANETPQSSRGEKQDVPDEDDEPEMNFWDE